MQKRHQWVCLDPQDALKKHLTKPAIPLTQVLVTKVHDIQTQQNKASNEKQKLEPTHLSAC